VFIQEKSNRDDIKRSEAISAASLPTSDQIEKLEQEISYEFFWPFVSANLLQILKIDLSFDPNFVA
jgi:hypothetical protein